MQTQREGPTSTVPPWQEGGYHWSSRPARLEKVQRDSWVAHIHRKYPLLGRLCALIAPPAFELLSHHIASILALFAGVLHGQWDWHLPTSQKPVTLPP